MTELRRLIDECDSELGQAILRAGREHAGDEVRRGRVLAALGVGAVVTASAKSTFAFSAAVKSVAWKKVLVGGVVAGGGFAGAALYQASPPPVEAPEAQVSEVAPAAEAIQVRPVQPAPEAPVAEVSELQLVEETPEPTGRAFRPRARDTASAASLNEELALLDQARAAIRQGRPNDALARLDEHSSRFPKGALALEAQVLRVQGLAAAGRTEEASRRAKRILSRSPNSVVAQRLRQYVIE